MPGFVGNAAVIPGRSCSGRCWVTPASCSQPLGAAQLCSPPWGTFPGGWRGLFVGNVPSQGRDVPHAVSEHRNLPRLRCSPCLDRSCLELCLLPGVRLGVPAVSPEPLSPADLGCDTVILSDSFQLSSLLF